VDETRAKRLLLSLALLSSLFLPLLTNLAGAFGVAIYQMSENVLPATVSLLQSILEVLAVFAMYLYSGCLFFSVLLFGHKKSAGIAWLGAARIAIVYGSGLAVQFALGENFAQVAIAYIKDVVAVHFVLDLLLLLATVLLGLLFSRGKDASALRRPLTGLFDCRHPAVGGLLTLIALLLLVSAALNLISVQDVLSSLSEEESALLSISEYMLLAEPFLHLLIKAVCGYFLNIAVLSFLLAPLPSEEDRA